MNLDAIHAAVNECIEQLKTGTFSADKDGERITNSIIQALEVCDWYYYVYKPTSLRCESLCHDSDSCPRLSLRTQPIHK